MTNFINNQWVNGNGKEFMSVNPVTGETVWQGFAADTRDVDAAVHAARRAFDAWAILSITERENLLKKFAAELTNNKESLADLISRETGKPVWESLTEVGAMINKVAISIEAFAKRCAEFSTSVAGKNAATRFKPHGVVAVFGPYNFPGHLANGHIVPALLAGNTVVFKPSELSPGVAEATVKIWMQAGLPKGILNLVQGARATGEAILAHPQIDGVFFTGSSATGTLINQVLAKRPNVILALEMGGNNPLVVWDAKNLDAAALIAIESAYITAGQRCTCARRLIVAGDKIGDDFIVLLKERIAKIKIGAPTERPEPFMAALVSNGAADKVLQAQAELKKLGASILIESRRLHPQQAILTPGLIDVTAVKNRPDREVFGPLLQIVRVADFNAAITEANNTEYGLAAGLVSNDETLYTEFRRRVRAGLVNFNTPLTGASSAAPFGGVGLSGNHRPSAYFAADYCSFPVASMEAPELKIPEKLLPGL